MVGLEQISDEVVAVADHGGSPSCFHQLPGETSAPASYGWLFTLWPKTEGKMSDLWGAFTRAISLEVDTQ